MSLPAELQASAWQLRSQASEMESAAGQLAGRLTSLRFAGPAADRLRVDVEAQRRQLLSASTDLRNLAAAMDREAAEIAARQRLGQ